MQFFDIHTHNSTSDKEYSILDYGTRYIADRTISVGIHPWYITGNWKEDFARITELINKDNIAAIGECGIDKLRSRASIELQIEIFRAHAMLAEKAKKPLIIHCVKSVDEVVSLKKEISPTQAWIIHGFRGNCTQATQLTNAGFYISFGEKFNRESIIAIPDEKLLIESDESPKNIIEIYRSIADARECSIDELQATVTRNIKNCGIEIL